MKRPTDDRSPRVEAIAELTTEEILALVDQIFDILEQLQDNDPGVESAPPNSPDLANPDAWPPDHSQLPSL